MKLSLRADVSAEHWTDQLFLQHADVFLKLHESAIEKAEEQARQVEAILRCGNVAPPARILDAPCGIGRHDVHLARFGYRVTGVDFSPVFLERARALAATVGSEPEFVPGDIRTLGDVLEGRRNTFAAILNLWTSIGYWGDEVDRDVFRQFHALAAPHALLVIDTINRDFVVRTFRPQGWESYGDLVHIEEREFDFETSWIRGPWRFYQRRNGDLFHVSTISVDHRAYAPHELKRLVESVGWRTVGLFGSLAMEALAPDRPRIVLVERKEA